MVTLCGVITTEGANSHGGVRRILPRSPVTVRARAGMRNVRPTRRWDGDPGAPAPPVARRGARAGVRAAPGVAIDLDRPAGAAAVAKALLDRIGAAFLMVVMAPLLVAVAAAVALSSSGPVLYKQRRVGRDGETFDCLKFRTMACDAERAVDAGLLQNECDGLLFKVHDDPRVTRVGHTLRRLSLDELPQFWNVVRGDMSLVGPRPLPVQPGEFVGAERRRLDVRPGITGLWQVSGRSELSWAESIRLDLQYVDEWSLLLDLRILARTPLAVLRGRGAW